MKRIAKLMCLIALVALVGISCKKQEEQRTFTATLGNGEWKYDGEDKLYLADKKMWFEIGDQVVLCNVNYDDPTQSEWDRFEAIENGTTTTFAPVGGSTPIYNDKMSAWFAYYPGEVGMCSFNGEGTSGEQYHPETYSNYGFFKLAPVQEYRTLPTGTAVPKSALFAAAKDEVTATWNDANFAFTPISGLLRLKFYEPSGAKVKSVSVTDPDRNLVGYLYLCIDKVVPTEMEHMLNNYNPNSNLYMQQLATYCHNIGYRVPGIHEGNTELSHTLTLNCDNADYPGGVTVGTTSATATEFILGVRPAAFFGGIIVDVVYEVGSTEHHYHIDATGQNLMIKPATVKKISAIKLVANND